ncbi:hypothetical protein HAX54_045363, partial [Datura stramonium]|nr:hypothetical protein [Datura stramonium]
LSQGRCVAATLIGGLMNKMSGRIGDSPLISTGTYTGELCGELGLQDGVECVIKKRLDKGFVGLIAMSNKGEVAYGFNCNGMFRGYATEDGFLEDILTTT